MIKIQNEASELILETKLKELLEKVKKIKLKK